MNTPFKLIHPKRYILATHYLLTQPYIHHRSHPIPSLVQYQRSQRPSYDNRHIPRHFLIQVLRFYTAKDILYSTYTYIRPIYCGALVRCETVI